MKIENVRGFNKIVHKKQNNGKEIRLVQESSAVGNYEGASKGGSFLWIGQDHLLNRKEVGQLIVHLQTWLDTGRLTGETEK